MSANSFKMLMRSGVIRPGHREIRRLPEPAPRHWSNPLPHVLNNFMEVPFAPTPTPNRAKGTDGVKQLHAHGGIPSNSFPSRFSWRSILIWLGVLGRTGRKQPLEPCLRQGPQNSMGKLEERVRILESLLRIQKLHCQTQCEELAALRSQVSRIEQLQVELTVERESGERLVQWLQEAEQKLADVDARRLGGLNPLF